MKTQSFKILQTPLNPKTKIQQIAYIEIEKREEEGIKVEIERKCCLERERDGKC